MKLSNVRRIAKEEISEAPDWIDKLLTPLNQSIEQLTKAVSGQLSYGDNLFCSIQTNKFTHGVELITKNPLPSGVKPIGIHVFSSDGDVGIDGYRLSYKATGEVGVTVFFKCVYGDAYLARTANQTINIANDVPIEWNLLRRLSGSLSWSSTTNPSRIICNTQGLYLFNFTLAYTVVGTGTRTMWLSKNADISSNGSRYGMSQYYEPGIGSISSLSSSASIEMLPGDYVEFYTRHDNAAAIDVSGGSPIEVSISGHSVDLNNGFSSNVNYVLLGG